MEDLHHAGIRTAPRQSSELLAKRELFSPERTLGSLAVGSQARYMGHLVQHTLLPEGSQKDAALRASQVSASIVGRDVKEARVELAQYGGRNAASLGRYIKSIVPDTIAESQRYTFELHGVSPTWSQWLKDKATDEEVLQVLASHNDVVYKQAKSPELAAAIDDHQLRFAQMLDRWDTDGLFGLKPKHPLSAPILVGDVFDTYLKDRDGYYNTALNEIVIGQGHLGEKGAFVDHAIFKLPRVLTHELIHALMGTALTDSRSPLSHRWINEASTEAFSRIARKENGEQHIADDIYVDERDLLGVVLAPSMDAKKQKQLWVRAYTGTDEDRDVFAQYVDELWGSTNVLHKVSLQVAAEEKKLRGSGLGKQEIQSAAAQAVRQSLLMRPDDIMRRTVDDMHEADMIAAQRSKK